MPSKTDINPSTGKMYAVNPATGHFDDNYWANVVEPQLRAGGGSGGGFSGGSGGGFGDVFGIAGQAQQFQQQGLQPAINSVKERYKALLDEVSQSASNELGKRGIPLSSTSAQEFIQSKQRPVIGEQAGAIANLQAAPTLNALPTAIEILKLQQQQGQFDQSLANQKSGQSAGEAGINSLFGGVGQNAYSSIGNPPSGSPASGGSVNPTAGFTASNINNQVSSGGLFGSSGPFSLDNVQYAGNLAKQGVSNVGNFLGGILNKAQQGAASFYGFK